MCDPPSDVIPDAGRWAGILVMHTCTMAERRYTPSSAISGWCARVNVVRVTLDPGYLRAASDSGMTVLGKPVPMIVG